MSVQIKDNINKMYGYVDDYTHKLSQYEFQWLENCIDQQPCMF